MEDIAQVGPFGDFLSLDATLRHMRELCQPEFLDRRVREDWEERGAKDLYAACLEKARDSCGSIDPSRSGRRRRAHPRHRREDRPGLASGVA